VTCTRRGMALSSKKVSRVEIPLLGVVYFLINVYLDSFQAALKYLKNTEINISNVLKMIGNFNIRDNSWDPNFSHYSHHSNVLFKIADFFQLELSRPTKQVPTRYLDN